MFVSILTLILLVCNEIFIAICVIFIYFSAINFYSKRLTVCKKAVMIKKETRFYLLLFALLSAVICIAMVLLYTAKIQRKNKKIAQT